MDPRIQKILMLPLYGRLAILASCIALVGIVFYFGIYQFQQQQYDDLVRQHASLQRQYQEKKQISDHLGAYQAEYKQLEAQLAESLKELPQKKEIPSLLTSISETAKAQGLEVLLFRPKNEVRKDFYAEVPVDINLLGSYHQVALFFEAVGQMSRIVNIDDVKLKRKGVNGKTATLDVVCRATTFRFLDSSEISKHKKGRGRR